MQGKEGGITCSGVKLRNWYRKHVAFAVAPPVVPFDTRGAASACADRQTAESARADMLDMSGGGTQKVAAWCSFDA